VEESILAQIDQRLREEKLKSIQIEIHEPHEFRKIDKIIQEQPLNKDYEVHENLITFENTEQREENTSNKIFTEKEIENSTDTQEEKQIVSSKSTYRNKIAEVLYEFQARNDRELSIKPGDIIKIIDNSGEWWYGELDGKVGIFPGNYVTVKKPAITVRRASTAKILELQAKCGFYDSKPVESSSKLL